MFQWIKNRYILRKINKYKDSNEIRDLILKIFGLKDSNTRISNNSYEDNVIKVSYSRKDDLHTYIVYVKDGDELIKVFHRDMDNGCPDVKVLVVGAWIYHLFLVYKKKIPMKDIVDVYKNNKLKRTKNVVDRLQTIE